MKSFRRLCGILLALMIPVSLAARASAAPIRELVYNYTALYESNGESHYGGIGGFGSGVSNDMGSGSRTGTVTFDVLSVAKDGGLVIHAKERIQNQPRDSAEVTCAVYGDGRVMCGDAGPSDVENVLLMLLGRDFFQPERVDQNGHWTRDLSTGKLEVITDFSTTLPLARMVKINAKTVIKGANQSFHDWTENETFTYDTAMSIPTQVHDKALEDSRGSGYLRTTIDASLVSDSFATPSPKPSPKP